MAEDDPSTPKPPVTRAGCAWLFGGFFASGLVGAGLAFWLVQNNGPQWAAPVAFFAPPVLYLVVFGAVAVPRFLRQVREMRRNAPSPESVAAPAAGEGVPADATVAVPAAAGDGLPAVPVVRTRPGKVLAHRLDRAGLAPGCQFGCAVVGAAFWNGIVGIFVYRLFDRWNKGQAMEWVEALFLVPFVVIGLVLVGVALYAGLQWIVSLLVGEVQVELSDHPLGGGAAVRVHVGQTGTFPLGRAAVALVCTEEATYVAGTSKSTAKKEVVRHPVADPDQSPDGGGLPLAAEFAVPPGAMHSFDAPNNKIKWTLRVTGRVLGVLPFYDEYGVCVVPRTGA